MILKAVVLICTLGLALCTPFVSDKQHYTVGGWTDDTIEILLKEWGPILQDYLTSTVGSMYQPPIDFTLVPADFTPNATSTEMFNNGQLDFMYTHSIPMVCLVDACDVEPLVIQRHSIAGKEANGYGGVIFTAKNSSIYTIFDLAGKDLGMGNFWASAGFALPWLLFADNGIDLFSTVDKIVFYQNDYERQMRDVLSGVVDVGFTQSAWFEHKHPDMMKQFRFIHLINVTYQGELYPFLTSTRIVPTFGLAAGPHIPWTLRQHVATALMALNSSHPAVRAAGISTFTLPGSYDVSRQNARKLGVMVEAPDGRRRCFSPFSQIYDVLTCPAGFVKNSREAVLTACERGNIDCPEGLQCVCKPCLRDEPIQMFRVGSESSIPCDKMHTCATGEQGGALTFRVVNARRANITYQVSIGTAATGQCEPPGEVECQITFTMTARGAHLVEIFANGQQASFSPFVITILDKQCGNGTTGVGVLNKVADAQGMCVCPSHTLDLYGSCFRADVLLPAVILPAAAVVLVAVIFMIRAMLGSDDAAWEIDPSEIIFDRPRHVLGRGAFGLVVRAHYRNTPVAVKRMLPISLADQGPSTNTFSFLDDDPIPAPDDPRPAPPPRLPASRSLINQIGGSPLPRRTRHTLSRASSSRPLDDAGSLWGPVRPFGEWRSGAGLMRLVRSEAEEMRSAFLAEMRILARIRHPNVVALMGAVHAGGKDPLLVMECMILGSLWDMLHNKTCAIDGEIALEILQGVANAMTFLHAFRPRPLLHNDLKASNVLLNDKLQPKVSDFSLSSRRHWGRAGSAFWKAPECLGGAPNSPKSDVYSFAILMQEVLSRKEPYPREDPTAVLAAVRRGDRRPRVDAVGWSATLVQLMTECWAQDPAHRPAFEEIHRRLVAMDSVEVASRAWRHQGRRRTLLSLPDGGGGCGAAGGATERTFSRFFPAHVADAVTNGRKVPPEHKGRVSVCFSEVVDFEGLHGADGVALDKMLDMLDRLYGRFDELAGQHGVLKLETIGESYFCATNLLDDQDDSHAARMARFAMAALQAAQATPVDADDESRGFINIRIGICSGPVTACVIGGMQPKYTLFGDTVNTASRMESTASPGCIQCPKHTAQEILAQDASIPLTCRGDIEIKGKGLMTTFWIDQPGAVGCKPGAEPDPNLTSSGAEGRGGGSVEASFVFPAAPRLAALALPGGAPPPPPSEGGSRRRALALFRRGRSTFF